MFDLFYVNLKDEVKVIDYFLFLSEVNVFICEGGYSRDSFKELLS